jgi:hypothetical protein
MHISQKSSGSRETATGALPHGGRRSRYCFTCYRWLLSLLDHRIVLVADLVVINRTAGCHLRLGGLHHWLQLRHQRLPLRGACAIFA